ncbi:MAG: Nif3-like dinuclear metal center hexameric protein [Bacteroidia bacterium]|nr:Nif3-like dinuclear metal center hexameric protein [Bacteroidia bacterium]
MKLKDLTSFLDSAIPLSFQEGYDNAGLQVGLPDKEVASALITLDVTEEVLDEAISKSCDIIISHHPLIFTGLKRLSGRSYTEKILLKAIKQDIAIYSAHTNLDVLNSGVSRKMAEKLKLKNVKVLLPLKNKLLKLVTYIPENHFEKVRDAVFNAGAGVIGNYDKCSFSTSGTGSFMGGENTNPFTGEKGKLHFEKEVRFETVLFSHLKGKVINALHDSHPYEEVAYDIYTLENESIDEGMGCIGELSKPIEEKDFLNLLSSVFSAKGIRYSKLTGKRITRVALCGGAGGPLVNDAVASGADVFVTADIRYHSFFDAGNKMLIADIGHYESEKFSVEILYNLIIKNFPTFAVRFSEINTNPINYL